MGLRVFNNAWFESLSKALFVVSRVMQVRLRAVHGDNKNRTRTERSVLRGKAFIHIEVYISAWGGSGGMPMALRSRWQSGLGEPSGSQTGNSLQTLGRFA